MFHLLYVSFSSFNDKKGIMKRACSLLIQTRMNIHMRVPPVRRKAMAGGSGLKKQIIFG
jgi:hypothetical protein